MRQTIDNEELRRKYNPDGSTLRKAQLRMLHILKVVDSICQKHGIQYVLDGGTLLGAVRHGGFIPWDDDLDITVMRKDLKRLRKILPKELPSDLVYQDCTTDKNFPFLIAKVRDRNSCLFEELEWSRRIKEKGIYIDIIPMEDMPSLTWKKKLDYWYGHCVRGVHHYANKKDTLLSAIVLPFSWALVTVTRFVNVFRHADQVAHVYGWGAYNSFSKKDLYPIKRMQFEDMQVCVPSNPDAVLSRLFGDYMQIPPENNRNSNGHIVQIEFYDKPIIDK